MTISRAQMNRQLYQMGGIGTLPMDYGQPLQVPQQQQPSFSSAQNITMNPLLNYGQPQLGGGTPLTMAGGGISRLGYQEGGMGMEMMQPQMQDPMMQEQMMQPPMQDQMQGQMMQGAGGEEQGKTAILTIIQLLIEQGIDPETAKELAMQILQAFAQGGEPAVEALANQLEQEEGMQQEPMMMAEGGLTSIDRARDMLQRRAPSGEFLAYINPQEAGILRSMGGAGQDVNVRGVPSFFIKKAVKSVVKAVKSVAKSPIGQIALAIAAPYAISAMFPAFATFGTASLGTFGGAALRAGISNLAIQGITTGKFNPKQALLAAAAGGALASFNAPVGIDQGTINAGGAAIPGADIAGTSTLSSGVTQSLPTSSFSELTGQVAPGSMVYNPPTTAAGTYPSLGLEVSPTSPVVNVGAPQPNIFERGIASVQDIGNKFMSDPIGTIGRGVGATYELAKKYPTETILAATAAIGALTPQQPGEPDNSYQQRKAEHDSKVAQYITQYGGGTKLYSPSFYAMEGAVDPFAGRSTYAANGGRIGYEYGSMPMGEPRQNQAGIMELDYRAKGGFVPPVGIKEKADDIPAMLSNNEFVFTANAVRNAGGGNVNKGAERMYGLMKKLEAGGVV